MEKPVIGAFLNVVVAIRLVASVNEISLKLAQTIVEALKVEEETGLGYITLNGLSKAIQIGGMASYASTAPLEPGEDIFIGHAYNLVAKLTGLPLSKIDALVDLFVRTDGLGHKFVGVYELFRLAEVLCRPIA